MKLAGRGAARRRRSGAAAVGEAMPLADSACGSHCSSSGTGPKSSSAARLAGTSASTRVARRRSGDSSAWRSDLTLPLTRVLQMLAAVASAGQQLSAAATDLIQGGAEILSGHKAVPRRLRHEMSPGVEDCVVMPLLLGPTAAAL